MKKITFNNNGLNMAGLLFLPENFDENKKYPAIVCIHPGSSCKEQTTSIYAEKLAKEGFVMLAFDASYQGESGGTPRYVEFPFARIEDARCAIDYLVTLPYVDEEKIGVLGICAGGGYAVATSMIERRIKAVGTVAGVNIGRLQRESAEDITKVLEEVAKERTKEARGANPMIVQWIPKDKDELAKTGLTNIDVVEAVDYYTTERGKKPGSPNKLNFVSMAEMIGFDAFHLVDVLLTQPLQIVIGAKEGAFGSYRDGMDLYLRAASKNKNLCILDNVSHYDLYDMPVGVDKALEKLVPFYKENL